MYFSCFISITHSSSSFLARDLRSHEGKQYLQIRARPHRRRNVWGTSMLDFDSSPQLPDPECPAVCLMPLILIQDPDLQRSQSSVEPEISES